MSERQSSISTVTQLVLAGVAVVGLSGTAVHYVAAQTGKVEVQAAELKSVSAQIPFIWNAVQLQGAKLDSLEKEIVAAERRAEERDKELLKQLLDAIKNQDKESPS